MGVDQSTWLISFADLITLLLCAFLMFFSLTWNKTQVHGIQIANVAIESQKVSSLERRIELRFFNEDVDLATGRLTDEAVKKIGNIVKSGSYSDATVTLETCDTPGTLLNPHALRGQLVDTGVEEKQIAERFVGSNCELLKRDAHSEQDIRAIIRFERHG